MLCRTAMRRFATMRRSLPARSVSMYDGQKQAFGYGEVAPKDGPGFGKEYQVPPENVKDTVAYISGGMTKLPFRKELIEGIGYPGQKQSAGTVTTVGRIYYGPGRYDYGRVSRPKGWFANWFYGFWEFGHLFFVADRWIAIRWARHVIATLICYIPFYYQMKFQTEHWIGFKKTFGS